MGRETRMTNDTISRQAAIEAMLEAYPDNMDVEFILRKLPSAQPEQRWIPCSERMPEHFDWYLVSDKETSWVALWKDGVFLSVSGYFEFSDIIAWMPIPHPYQPERRQ